MTKYETTVAFSVKNGEEQSKALVERFETLISENANLLKIDAWGVRRLAYEIDYEREAAYYVYTFECEEDFPAELERVLSITDGILRWLIVKAVEVAAPAVAEETVENDDAEEADESEVEEVAEEQAEVAEEQAETAEEDSAE